jgi:hypothetical protein
MKRDIVASDGYCVDAALERHLRTPLNDSDIATDLAYRYQICDPE